MSSDKTGSVEKGTKAVTEAAAANTGSADSTAVEEAQAADPWFAAGSKIAATANGASGADDGAAGDDREVTPRAASAGAGTIGASSGGNDETQAEWFLRTGRAGLLPDSITVIWDDDETSVPDGGHDFRVEAAGAPPWAAEAADLIDAPPPWETGPWPGPRGSATGSGAGRHQADGGSAGRADSVTGAHSQGGAPSEGGADSLSGAESGGGDSEAGIAARRHSSGSIAAVSAASRTGAAGRASAAAASGPSRWSARTVLVAGLVPLIIPGLVVGILGLRRAGAHSVRTASWVAIGASLAWTVVIVLILAGGSGGSAGACAGYPPAVHRAYDTAMTDLRDRAPASVLAADLGSAASLANATAAAAGQIGVRTALFTMASDMAQARAEVVAGRPVPGTLRTHLSDDASTPSGSCTS